MTNLNKTSSIPESQEPNNNVQKTILSTISSINKEVLMLTKDEEEFYEKESWWDLLVFLDKFHQDLLRDLIISQMVISEKYSINNSKYLYEFKIWDKLYFIEYDSECIDSLDINNYESWFWFKKSDLITKLGYENHLIIVYKNSKNNNF